MACRITASFFLGSARESIRHSLRPGHKSGRHARGSHVSEECQAGRDIRCLRRFVQALALYGNSKCWFDLSLISSHGRQEADRLKLLNRQTYQELIFRGLGIDFAGETYLLPEPIETGLSGDVAIAADAGPYGR